MTRTLPSSKFLRPLALSLLLGSSALAERSPVTVLKTDTNLIVSSDKFIRYQTDPFTHELLLPDSFLAADATIPVGVTLTKRPDSLAFTVPEGTTFALSPDGKQLIITPPSKLALNPLPADAKDPIYYRLTASDPATAATLLQSLYPSLRVVIDVRQRALIVLTNAADRATVLGLLAQIDQKRPQILIEAEILEINQDKTDSLGIQYDSIFTFKLGEGDVPGLLKLGNVTRNPLSLSLGINLLKTEGAAKVLAQPRITTIDGLEARINSTQTTPVVTSNTTGGTTVQTISTGITLRMTPKVAPDGSVEANLTISVSIPTGTTSQGIPQFSTREASTTVRVANGEPIAIGGLLEDRKVTGIQKVPVLGDIPLLGKLFTTTRTDTHRTDLVIVITPRLVQGPNERPAARVTPLPGVGELLGPPAPLPAQPVAVPPAQPPVVPATPIPVAPLLPTTPALPATTLPAPTLAPTTPTPSGP
jgi:general secretion pathway protein D